MIVILKQNAPKEKVHDLLENLKIRGLVSISARVHTLLFSD